MFFVIIFISVSLISNKVEQLFICLQVICSSYFMKCTGKLFAIFLSRFLFICSYLHIVHTILLLFRFAENSFSSSVDYCLLP